MTRQHNRRVDCLVIGGGPAGLTAAVADAQRAVAYLHNLQSQLFCSQQHSQEARVGRLVLIVIVAAIDIFYRLGNLVGVLPDIVQRGDRHCVESAE